MPSRNNNNNNNNRKPGLSLLFLWTLLLPRCSLATTSLPCLSTAECRDRLSGLGPRAGRTQSKCLDGFCTNPYHDDNDNDDNDQSSGGGGGCLRDLLPVHRRTRVCHSEDSEETLLEGKCRPSPWNYPEVRIHAQNWASALFLAWILQIVLTELLEVPATIETSSEDLKIDFYNRQAAYGFQGGNDWDAVRLASEVGDCRNVEKLSLPTTTTSTASTTTSTYRSCANVVPEVWQGHGVALGRLQDEGSIEGLTGVGALGANSWFVPQFVGARDPTLLTYLGLQGEHNRRKLAETFKRPTTWKDYCLQVSNSSCTQPDDTAQRAPETPEEEAKYFVAGKYTGHFRATEQNDCDKWPTNCTGHIADYPCGWSSHVLAQTHHLEIALESNGDQGSVGGYTYGQFAELWAAANATKSNLIMLYWSPSILYQTYAKSDAEFTKVSLPPPTQRCVHQRTDVSVRCSDVDDPTLLYGEPGGACDEAPHSLDKVISPSIFQMATEHDDPAFHSPAYDVVRNFRVSELQVGKMFDAFFQGATQIPALDARDAVCGWIRDNLEDVILPFVPPTYPRVVRQQQSRDPLRYAAVAVAATAMVLTLGLIGVVSVWFRNHIQIQKAPIDLVAFLLVGLLMIAAGALLLSAAPTDWQCVAVVYLTNLGYVLELLPVLVKMHSIVRWLSSEETTTTTTTTASQLFVGQQSATTMTTTSTTATTTSAAARSPTTSDQRPEQEQNAATDNNTVVGLVVSRQRLVQVVGGAAVVMFVLLVVWTWDDPPQKWSEYSLTGDQTSTGETIVAELHYCASSGGDGWVYFSFAWQLLLLFVASVLAFQTRHVKGDSEVSALALLIYSHLLFVVLRGVVHFLAQDTSLGRIDTASFQSLLYSLDALATLGIYFIPKLLLDDPQQQQQPSRFRTRNGSHGGRVFATTMLTLASQTNRAVRGDDPSMIAEMGMYSEAFSCKDGDKDVFENDGSESHLSTASRKKRNKTQILEKYARLHKSVEEQDDRATTTTTSPSSGATSWSVAQLLLRKDKDEEQGNNKDRHNVTEETNDANLEQESSSSSSDTEWMAVRVAAAARHGVGEARFPVTEEEISTTAADTETRGDDDSSSSDAPSSGDVFRPEEENASSSSGGNGVEEAATKSTTNTSNSEIL